MSRPSLIPCKGLPIGCARHEGRRRHARLHSLLQLDGLGLNALDYAVVALYLVAVTGFGSYFARFQKTTGDYFLTGRSVPWWAICFTIVATETSTLTFIGVPAAAYAGNMTFLQLAAGYVIGRLLVSLLFIPAYFRGDLVTSYQLLQRRFGSSVKTVAAGLFLITRSLADGIRLFATGLVIAIVTGVPVSITIVTLGVAMMIYTERGGVAAVIWTDVVQMFIYVAGALVVFAALLGKVPGGWDEVVRLGVPAGKFTVIDLSLDPTKVYTLWAGVIGGIALTLATHGTDQYLVQRLLSARSQAAAQRGLILSGFLVFAQFTLFLLIGAMLFAYHQHVPLSATLGRNDEILPRFIISALPHGAIGFIVAAIVAAALSPSLNAMAATTINDFYLKVRASGRGSGDADAALAARDLWVGDRPARGRARRAIHAAVSARCRSVGAFPVCRTGAGRIHDRRPDAPCGIARHAWRHACRCRRDVPRLVDGRARVDLVRVCGCVDDEPRLARAGHAACVQDRGRRWGPGGEVAANCQLRRPECPTRPAGSESISRRHIRWSA